MFTAEFEPVAEIKPIAYRTYQRPLVVLAFKVRDLGYLPQVRAIARGTASGQLPKPLAAAICHELDGWHVGPHICCGYNVQQASSWVLKHLFNEEVPA